VYDFFYDFYANKLLAKKFVSRRTIFLRSKINFGRTILKKLMHQDSRLERLYL
jgi:hypothetical protein